MTYEVEIRFIAETAEEAFTTVPFLEASLGESKEWSTEILDRSIFEDGRLLRVGWAQSGDVRLDFIGFKGPDEGRVANIRQEWGEEISDGIVDSQIMALLGLSATFATADAIRKTLVDAGHVPFMSFSGVDRLGHHAPLAIHTKLARCPAILDDRVLVELEMEANTLTEAESAERSLLNIAEQYNIVERLVRDEPPTMLYKRIA